MPETKERVSKKELAVREILKEQQRNTDPKMAKAMDIEADAKSMLEKGLVTDEMLAPFMDKVPAEKETKEKKTESPATSKADTSSPSDLIKGMVGAMEASFDQKLEARLKEIRDAMPVKDVIPEPEIEFDDNDPMHQAVKKVMAENVELRKRVDEIKPYMDYTAQQQKTSNENIIETTIQNALKPLGFEGDALGEAVKQVTESVTANYANSGFSTNDQAIRAIQGEARNYMFENHMDLLSAKPNSSSPVEGEPAAKSVERVVELEPEEEAAAVHIETGSGGSSGSPEPAKVTEMDLEKLTAKEILELANSRGIF